MALIRFGAAGLAGSRAQNTCAPTAALWAPRQEAAKVLPPGHRIGKVSEEEMAFGLKCLVLYIVMPEQTEGGTEPVERALSGIKGVGRVETDMVTRY